MPKFMYPRFYFCKTSGSITINHRLTHSYVGSADSDEELVEKIKELNAMGEEEFWKMMIFQRYVSIKSPTNSATKDPHLEEREKWFEGAWSVFTDLFYTQNPKLLVVEEQLPMEIINKVKREHYNAEAERNKKADEERRESERLYQEEQKAERLKARQKPEVKEGKIGSVGGLEKLKKASKKLKRKVQIKTKSSKVIEIDDSDDLFA